jgi:hypothetical protein
MRKNGLPLNSCCAACSCCMVTTLLVHDVGKLPTTFLRP